MMLNVNSRYFPQLAIKLIVFFTLILACETGIAQEKSEFLKEQLSHPNARAAWEKHFKWLEAELRFGDVQAKKVEIAFIFWKYYNKLHLYARNVGEEKFHFFRQFKVCFASGDLGPKRKEGDEQVPEGLYYIDAFNPVSSYQLSLRIDYPNPSDKILSDPASPGGDIFIHGDCVSVGCLAMSDSIAPIYTLALMAREAGQKEIPVLLLPCNLKEKNLNALLSSGEFSEEKKDFWRNLKLINDYFFTHKNFPKRKISSDGKYIID